jgi:hypothetical protein
VSTGRGLFSVWVQVGSWGWAASKIAMVDIGAISFVGSYVEIGGLKTLTILVNGKTGLKIVHIAVKYHHFGRSIGVDNGIILEKIDTTLQKADIFTKGLSADKHQAIRKLLMGW